MEISEEQYADFLEAQPKLQVYQHYFDKLLQGKEHVLSQREEELLLELVKSLVRQVKLSLF